MRRHPVRALVLVAFAMCLTACGLVYGASFDYPDEPPVPPDASVVAKTKGWDDDDPMRGREAVIDMAGTGPDALVDYYREKFPSSEGWSEGTPDADLGGGHLLCLVSNSDDDYDEYVEIYPYEGGRGSRGPDRYLVWISRLAVVSDDERTADRCGLAGIWFPQNL